MTYIILRDTFGRGLETISNIGVDVIEEHQLNEYICAAAEIILAEDGYESLSEYGERWDDDANPMKGVLVICKIVDELKGKNVDNYVQDVIKEKEKEENTEEYNLYLKLKEKFEK